jgi:hypothetical protein
MVIRSQIRTGPPLVRRLADDSRNWDRQSCHCVAGDKSDRRVLVLMRTVRGSRECQVVRTDDITRVTGLVPEYRGYRVAIRSSNTSSWSKW